MHWHQVHFSSSQGYYYCHMASNAGMLFLTCLIVLIKVSFHTVKKISLQTGVLFEIVAPCLHTGTTFIHLLMRSQFRSFRLLKRWSVVSSLHDQIRPNYWVIPVSIKAGFSDMPLCYFIEQCYVPLQLDNSIILCMLVCLPSPTFGFYPMKPFGFQTWTHLCHWWHYHSRLLLFYASMNTGRANVVCYSARVWVEIIVYFLSWHGLFVAIDQRDWNYQY